MYILKSIMLPRLPHTSYVRLDRGVQRGDSKVFLLSVLDYE